MTTSSRDRRERTSQAASCRGFTLVEIMVALGVFALVAVSAYGRMGGIVDQQRLLEERMLATWVAQNRITALELEHAVLPVGARPKLVLHRRESRRSSRG